MEFIKETTNSAEVSTGFHKDRVLAHTAFRKYVQDSLIAQFTPFEKAATIGYKDGFWYGAGNHPVAKHGGPGDHFSESEIMDKSSDPLFPDEVEDPNLVVL